jgi:hypothetical protein
VVHRIDRDAGHLLHAPAVRQRLRPERIDAELGRTVRVERLSRYNLRATGEAGGKYQGDGDQESAGNDRHGKGL